MVEAKWFVDQDTQTDKDIEPNAALTGDQNAALLRAEILKLKKELDDCKAELAETKDLPTDLLSLSPEARKERQEKAFDDMSWQMQKSMMDNDQKLRDKFMARITALESENKSMSLELRKLRSKYDDEKKRSGSLVESYSNAVKLIPKSPMYNEIPTQEYDPLDDFNLDEYRRRLAEDRKQLVRPGRPVPGRPGLIQQANPQRPPQPQALHHSMSQSAIPDRPRTQADAALRRLCRPAPPRVQRNYHYGSYL